MQEQLKFILAEKTPDHQAINALVAWLKNREGWTPAATIQKHLGLKDRRTRALASKSNGLILSAPGSPGYKHIQNATIEEINHITTKLEAQAKNMADRATQIRRTYHNPPRP